MHNQYQGFTQTSDDVVKLDDGSLVEQVVLQKPLNADEKVAEAQATIDAANQTIVAAQAEKDKWTATKTQFGVQGGQIKTP